MSVDVRDHDVRGAVEPRFYVAMQQSDRFPSEFNVELHTANPARLVEPVRQAMRAWNPAVPIDDLMPLNLQISQRLDDERLIASLSSVFGALALVLAAIGLYGVVSFGVARRTHEIGVRLALGADRAKVLGLVLRETLWLAAVGIAVGVPLTLFAMKGIETRLAGLSPYDPPTIAGAAAVLVLIAVLSGAAPGIRALRIEPTRALRES